MTNVDIQPPIQTTIVEGKGSNAALMARRVAALPKGMGQSFPIFIERALNAELFDVEGKRYIDFAGGIGVLNVGHNHPKVVAAVTAQASRVMHTAFTVTAYEPYVELAEKLCELTKISGPKKAMFANSGAEAVENAIKIARAYTQRPGIIAFGGSFHGRTNLTMGLTGKVVPYKAGFGPFPTDIYHADFPTDLHGVSISNAIDSVKHILKYSIEPNRVAAILIEPIQGEGGFNVAPNEFMTQLKAICVEHNIVLIADEVQAGAGRTGTWLASQAWDVEPDIVTVAKSIGAGMPISGVIGRAEIMDSAAVGGLGGTYGGNPLSCAAALAVLDIFESEQLLERAVTLGDQIRLGFNDLALQHKEILEVRGRGAMIAAEFGIDGDVTKPAVDLVNRISVEAQKLGLIVLTCGVYANCIRCLVPLTASSEIVAEGFAILGKAIAAAKS